MFQDSHYARQFTLIFLMVAPVQSSSERETNFMDFQWIYKGKVQLCQTEGTHAKETGLGEQNKLTLQ
jgi:hypothetical protein